MKFYYIPDSYFAQIEAWALIGFRFGGTCFGVAFWPPKRDRRPWWVPGLVITVNAHTGQCDMVNRLKINAGRHYVRYCSMGEAVPGHWRHDEVGFTVR